MNIYNSEMYPDPTAYHALTKIQKEEKAANDSVIVPSSKLYLSISVKRDIPISAA